MIKILNAKGKKESSKLTFRKRKKIRKTYTTDLLGPDEENVCAGGVRYFQTRARARNRARANESFNIEIENILNFLSKQLRVNKKMFSDTKQSGVAR